MSWNKNDTSKAEKPSNKLKLVRWLATTGIIIALLAGTTIYFLNWASNNPDENEEKRRGKIETTQADIGHMDAGKRDAGNSTEMQGNEDGSSSQPGNDFFKTPPQPESDIGKIVTNAFGQVFTIEAVVKPRGPRMNGKELVRDRRLFKSNAENLLDGIMNQPTGDRMLGTFDFDEFEKEFIANLNNKIEITEEDNEDEVRRKLEMIDFKEGLKEAYEKGESIADIVKQYFDEQTQIALIRDTLMIQLAEIKNSGADEEEVEEYYEAANKLLAEYDAMPVVSPKTAKARMKKFMNK